VAQFGSSRYVRGMQIYMFASKVDRNVVGLTGDKTGADLPAYLAPWAFRGSTLMPEGDPRRDAAAIREVVGRGGHCLAPIEFVP
jgi:hypothetical protein